MLKQSVAMMIVLVGSSAVAQPTSPTQAPPPAQPPVAAAEAAPAAEPAPALDAAEVTKLVEAKLADQPKLAGWKDGFYIQSADKAHKLKIGGFIQFDGRMFFNDEDDKKIDQIAFRSVRPSLDGTVFDHFDFKLVPDFAGSRIVLQDAWVDIRFSDKIKFRFGKFTVPFGLERLQGQTALTFVERGLPSLLTPNRDNGALVFGELGGGAASYQVGVYNGVAEGGSGDGDTSDDKEMSARVFFKPLPGAFKELGFGGAVTYGDKAGTIAAPDVTSAFRTQGQTTIFGYKVGSTLSDTVVADGKHWRATGGGYYYYGPFGVMAEYVRTRQRSVMAGTHEWIAMDSWQVLGQWVVTGGKASYKSVTPAKPFDPKLGQIGEISIAARLGEIRMPDARAFDIGFMDATKSARRAWSAGGGLDWFMNRNIRLTVDVEHTWFTLGAKGETGATDRAAETSLVSRVQASF
jgi:phosphate-selective porin OprO/OprP